MRLAAGGLVLGLSACGGSHAPDLRSNVAAITDAVNARSPDEVRLRVSQLESRLDDDVARGELTSAQADEIRTLALRVAENAGALAVPAAPPADAEVPSPVAPAAPAPGPEPEGAGPDKDAREDADEKDEGGPAKGKGKGKGKGSD